MSHQLAILNQLVSYDVARLFPTVADSKKEERATSVLLAVFRVVPTFALSMLQEAGAPSGKTAKVHCFVEVVPKNQKGAKLRPDGIIVVQLGKRIWTAIVEAKVRNAELGAEQIKSYVSLARSLQCDAILTVSNQFAALPTHHPVDISKTKLGKLGLYHFSWLSLVSKAVLLAGSKQIDDPEQTFILDELIRYLQHPKSGVSLIIQMGAGWRQVCDQVQQGTRLLKGSDAVAQVVSTWQQLGRFLALQLSLTLTKSVSIYMTRAEAKEPTTRLRSNIEQLVNKEILSASFIVPNVAGRIELLADLKRRSINISMPVTSPKDKKLPKACITWLMRQLKSADNDLLIRSHWPGRTRTTTASMKALKEDIEVIVPEGIKSLPAYLEVARVVDLAGGFRGKQKFVEETNTHLQKFYEEVGQSLRNWVAPAPRIKKQDQDKTSDEERKPEVRILDRILK